MGFSSLADLKSALEQNTFEGFFRKTTTFSSGTVPWSTWRHGDMPASGGDPATTPGTAYTNAGLFFPDSSLRKFLQRVGFRCYNIDNPRMGVLLFDRLVGVSGISVASTGNKTVNSTALGRYTSGEGVQCWLEVTTATTTTAAVVSMASYTNEAGTSGRAGGTITFPAAATAANLLVGPLPMQAGDRGIRSVETLNVGTAAAAGVVNVLLLKPLLIMGSMAQLASTGSQALPELELQMPLPYSYMPRIYDGASLMLALLGPGTNGGAEGRIIVVQG